MKRLVRCKPGLWLVLLLAALTGYGQNERPLEVSLSNSRSSNQGYVNVIVQGLMFSDPVQDYVPQRFRGIYPSIGFEIVDLSYEPGAARKKYNFELLGDLLYFVGAWVAKGDKEWNEDPDDRYSLSSYFSGGFLEATLGNNILSRKRYNLGAGLTLYDLVLNHKTYDAQGVLLSDKTPLNTYSLHAGPALFADVLLRSSLTLHWDFFYGWGLWHNNHEGLVAAGEPKRPFNSWKSTATLLHQSGLLIGFRYHRLVNRSSVATEAARMQIVLGYRIGMYRYNGKSHQKDPRHDNTKVTF